MPDKKLTDSEIKKVLEETIELRFDGESEYATIRLNTLTNALDLINRLEAEKAVLNRKLTDAYLMIDKLRGD